MKETAQKFILVVSLWVKDENVSDFVDYERRAARLIEKHGGRIERVVRVKRQLSEDNHPFEIHLVSFASEQKFGEYRSDAETVKLAEMRDKVIERTEIISGFDAESYH